MQAEGAGETTATFSVAYPNWSWSAGEATGVREKVTLAVQKTVKFNIHKANQRSSFCGAGVMKTWGDGCSYKNAPTMLFFKT